VLPNKTCNCTYGFRPSLSTKAKHTAASANCLKFLAGATISLCLQHWVFIMFSFSIINGFAVPIKKEHVDMLQQTLIPLHKVRHRPT
jgi:hypothetical protein